MQDLAWSCMGLDFTKLSAGSPADDATEPRRIFSALRRDPRYQYPRDVQSEVWNTWHDRRTERDLTIKMNTGGGKTAVGLVILKSCLNEGVGPALYVVPDRYLADQVLAEATALGIEAVADPRDARFRSGRAICVVNVFKLINGRSVFGAPGNSSDIPIGSLLVDDAHACVATVESQFTLRIPHEATQYSKILEIVLPALKTQSQASALDIEAGDYRAVLPVPFWAWADHVERILPLLRDFSNEDEDAGFVWPLIRDGLELCSVGISGSGIEIAPRVPAISRIPNAVGATRRIYMTATMSDDSILVTHFGADGTSLGNSICPSSADDLGERLILLPQETHPHVSEADVQELALELSRSINVVVIVPSERRSRFWKPIAVSVHDSSTIEDAVSKLRSGHVGLVVFIAKYDGIDLPGDACRMLILDGLPENYGELQRLEQLALRDSDAFVTRQIQRIEQGMGRGTRSNDDYCVVVLLGRRLVSHLYGDRAGRHFSVATRAQLELSRRVADMLRDEDFSAVRAVIDQCLDRDAGWVNAARNALDGVEYGASYVSDVSLARRAAADAAERGLYEEAADILNQAVNQVGDPRFRGWLRAELAAYIHRYDPVQASKILRTAVSENGGVAKPSASTPYQRISKATAQAESASEYLRERYADSHELIVGINSLLSDLAPDPDRTNDFEEAMHLVGRHLGFDAQRPERDMGRGPDVLWALSADSFVVVECKSGSDADEIHKRDAAQLSSSMDWFRTEYGESPSVVPLMVHKSTHLHSAAAPRKGMRVMTFDDLERFRSSVESLFRACAAGNIHLDANRLREQLAAMKLSGSDLLPAFSSKVRGA